jgi:hypothetical protein
MLGVGGGGGGARAPCAPTPGSSAPGLLNNIYLAYSVDYSVGSNFFKFLQIWIKFRLPIFSNPVLRLFSKYTLAVMADKSDEKLQRNGRLYKQKRQ